MTTQSIKPRALSTSDWHRIFARSSDEHEGSAGEHSFDDFDSVTVNEVVKKIAFTILMTDSDDRLDYLQTVNSSLTEEHLNQIAVATEGWLDSNARDRIRGIARHHYDNEVNPGCMLSECNTSEEIERLISMLEDTSIPDKTLAICYAMSVAYDAAFAAYFIHRERQTREVNFADIEQTEEEIAADLRFANAR